MRTLLLLVLVSLVTAAPTTAVAQSGSPVPPEATTGAAEAITQATARLTGRVDPNGTETTAAIARCGRSPRRAASPRRSTRAGPPSAPRSP